MNHLLRHQYIRTRTFPRVSALTLALTAVLYPQTSSAERYFNPAFLSADTASVADLTRFANGNSQAPGVYRVDIWRNSEFIITQDMQFAVQDEKNASGPNSGGLTPCVTLALLKRMAINMAAFPELAKYGESECIPLSTAIPDASSTFNFSRLRLDFDFPQVAMINSARGYIPPEEWDEGVPAALVNYSFSGNRGSDDDSYYLNLQSGLNYGPWRLRNNGAWSYNSDSHYNHWNNIGTWVQRTVIPLKGELVMGDSNTGNDVFDSVGFRGARLYSSDNMYPDSQQGYAPTVRGIARTPSKVTIRQNGYVIYQSYVQAGAFKIDDLNPTSSSGDLEVTVEEKGGQQQKFTVPYSTVPLLQREGRVKYDLTMGDYRSGDSDRDEPFFAQGTLLIGLPHDYTLYGGTQLASSYSAVALGAGKNLGDWGAVSLDVTHARSKLTDDSVHTGQSLRFLYAKSLNSFGTNFQLLGYRYSTRGFYTLDDVTWKSMSGYQYSEDKDENGVRQAESYHNLDWNKKGRFQVSISQSLGEWGSIYLSGNEQSYWGTNETNTWYQMGYAGAWKGASYSLSWSRNKSAGISDTDNIFAFNISVPFSVLLGHGFSRESALDRAWATTSWNQNSDGDSSWQSGVSGTLLEGQNLNYSVTQGHTSNSGYNGGATANWQATYGTLGVGYNYDKDHHDLNWQLSGGITGHENGITLSQSLGSTNVLIKAPGASGVSVENQTGVKTDWRGYTVMPYATVYRYNRIALDINTTDDHTDIKDNVSSVVPTEGALVRASFDTRIGIRALFTVHRDGKPVPFGAIVREVGSGVTSMAGEDGQIYISGLPMQGKLLVQWGDNDTSRCFAPYEFSKQSLQKTVTIADLTCSR